MTNAPLRLGSLCTGISGLERAVDLAGIETDTIFVSDIDKGACEWLDAKVDAPNVGDFTALSALPDVDLLTAGFPCQPLSLAGNRAGVHDERWLFDDITRLVGRMDSRPVLFLENVPGLLTANNGHAMARVVHGLAEIGYQLSYGLLPASAVGAPHRRIRWWGVAYSADADDRLRLRRASARGWGVAQHGAAVVPEFFAADSVSARREGEPFAVEEESPHSRPGCGRRPAADADSSSCQTRSDARQGSERARIQSLGPADAAERLRDRFGSFASAVGTWERVIGRDAPDPVDESGRLNSPFVEWMMGYPAGYVCDVIPARTKQLHLLGNAVVPQAAAEALRQLLARTV